MLSHFSCVQFLATLWTVDQLAFLPWYSPGKNTGVGCQALLQGIFCTRDWQNLYLLGNMHWQVGSLPLVPPGNPRSKIQDNKSELISAYNFILNN